MMRGGEVRPGWPVRVGVGYCEVRRGKARQGQIGVGCCEVGGVR